jgi:hypothetical protein
MEVAQPLTRSEREEVKMCVEIENKKRPIRNPSRKGGNKEAKKS